MLCLSQTTGYAIKALGCLNESPGQCGLIAEIAGRTGLPKPYLAKIVNSLARKGLVAAKRGHNGGISLARRPEEISLLQIVEAVEGKEWLGPCLLALDDCTSDNTCPTHDFWLDIGGRIRRKLAETTLAEIIGARWQGAARAGRGAAAPEPPTTRPAGPGAAAKTRLRRRRGAEAGPARRQHAAKGI